MTISFITSYKNIQTHAHIIIYMNGRSCNYDTALSLGRASPLCRNLSRCVNSRILPSYWTAIINPQIYSIPDLLLKSLLGMNSVGIL